MISTGLSKVNITYPYFINKTKKEQFQTRGLGDVYKRQDKKGAVSDKDCQLFI